MLDPTYGQDYKAVGGEGVEDFEEVEEIENPRKRQESANSFLPFLSLFQFRLRGLLSFY